MDQYPAPGTDSVNPVRRRNRQAAGDVPEKYVTSLFGPTSASVTRSLTASNRDRGSDRRGYPLVVIFAGTSACPTPGVCRSCSPS